MLYNNKLLNRLIYYMPSANLIIVHPCSIIQPLKSATISKFLSLSNLLLNLNLLFGEPKLKAFVRYPRHCQPERIVMRFFNQRPSYMRHLQVVKEHINVWCLIADINIQIAIFI